MQHIPTYDVTIGDVKYQLRKMTPARAGYIWQRVMHAMLKAQQESSREPSQDEAEAARKAMEGRTADERVRGMVALALMYVDLADFEFIQTEAMQAVSRWEAPAGAQPVPMPVMRDPRTWAIAEVADDPQLVTRLTVEVVAFNCVGFLSGSTAAAKI
jgi:hypothetical protein